MTAPQATLILPCGEFPTTIHIMDLETNYFSVSSPLPQEVVRPLVDNLFQVIHLAHQDVEAAKSQGPQEEGPDHAEEETPRLPDPTLTPATAHTPEADTTQVRALEVAVPTVVDLDDWDRWCRESQGLESTVDPRTHGHLVALYQKGAHREH